MKKDYLHAACHDCGQEFLGTKLQRLCDRCEGKFTSNQAADYTPLPVPSRTLRQALLQELERLGYSGLLDVTRVRATWNVETQKVEVLEVSEAPSQEYA
jgi:hypothetical protein